MNYKKEYQRYLVSPEWLKLRAQARERSGNKCEFCGGTPDHVHHVKYPKKYKDDHIDNLVVACESCHSKLHGIRNDLYIGEWIAEAVGLVFDGAIPRVEMKFSVLPEKHSNIHSLGELSKVAGNQRATDILWQFEGYIQNGYENFKIDLSLKSPLLEELNTSMEEVFMHIFENNDYSPIDEHSALADSLLRYLSLGPVQVVFRK